MARLATHLQALRPLGWPGVLGAACITLALLLALLVQPQWDTQTADLQAQTEQLVRRQRAAQTGSLGQPVADSAATAQHWVASLPSVSRRQKRLANLLELGVQQGLTAVRTEHRVSADATSGLERLRISMPVKGSYVQIRGFIAAALIADPALSLDGLKLRRHSAMAADMEADLQWSLHSRRGGDQ